MKSENGTHAELENGSKAQAQMVGEIEKKQARKLHARRSKKKSLWLGLGMMGAVGWSVAIPTLIGIILGIWLDARWPGTFSWTLLLLISGLLLGCANAWLWVAREQRSIEKNKETHKSE
jgi:ATP synthase protein I